MTSAASDTSSDDALQAYLEELLGRGPADGAPLVETALSDATRPPQPDPKAEPEYRLLRAGSVRVALAASAVAHGGTATGEHGDRGRRWLDLASVLHGHPVTVPSPVVPVVLAETPDWGLSVDAEEGVVQVADDGVTWRVPRVGRRWLAGLIQTHGAVVIDSAALLEEAEGHGIQGAL
ncbi:MAG: hypothetical protein JJU27_14830 [Gammaproteobacteria bacterium]|nr:hypothetical protein [Gammaproteobacteria bacterium]